MCLTPLHPFETYFIHVNACVIVCQRKFVFCLCLCLFSSQGQATIDVELHLPKHAKVLPHHNPLVHYDVFLYKVAKSPKHGRTKHRVRWQDCEYCVCESPFTCYPSYNTISTRSLPAIIHERTRPRNHVSYTSGVPSEPVL